MYILAKEFHITWADLKKLPAWYVIKLLKMYYLKAEVDAEEMKKLK